jgi:hypothetical protein
MSPCRMHYAAPVHERPPERNRDVLRRTAARVLDGCVRVHPLVQDDLEQQRPDSAGVAGWERASSARSTPSRPCGA